MRDREPHAVDALVSATVELASAGLPLMRRVVPHDDAYRVWDHYPEDDAVDADQGTRWFYHAHPPTPGRPDEHGHFHLFFDRRHFSARRAIARPPVPKRDAPKLVHIVALSIDQRGLPVRVFTVNRWSTDEWMYPAGEIADRLPRFTLNAQGGDALVDRWLTAAVAAFAPEIREALTIRDRAIAGRGADFFEARDHEVLSCVDVDLERLG